VCHCSLWDYSQAVVADKEAGPLLKDTARDNYILPDYKLTN